MKRLPAFHLAAAGWHLPWPGVVGMAGVVDQIGGPCSSKYRKPVSASSGATGTSETSIGSQSAVRVIGMVTRFEFVINLSTPRPSGAAAKRLFAILRYPHRFCCVPPR